MRPRPRSLVTILALSILAVAPSCGKDDAAPPATDPGDPAGPEGTAPPEPGTSDTASPETASMPTLRAGTHEPELLDPVDASLLAQQSHAGAHYYELRLPRAWQDGDRVVRVHVEAPSHAVATVERAGGETNVLLRVPKRLPPATEIRGTAFIAIAAEGHGWRALPFRTAGAAAKTGVVELPRRWADAFGDDLRGEERPYWLHDVSHPWREFAAGRTWAAMVGGGSTGATVSTSARPRRTELSELMFTTTAATSMQEALQHDRGLRLRTEPGPTTVPLSELETPPLVDHPFATMQAALPDPMGGAHEPLAAATPSDFWYVRFDDIRVLLKVLDEADAWITPVVHVMEERAEVRDLADRYQRQLGLRRSGLAKALGHTVIERVAIVGSDPYLREGSDVTFVFEVTGQTVFDTELGRHMAAYEGEIPGVTESSFEHGGHTVTVHRDPAGLVRQHRAQVGDLAVVSNSDVACRAVLDAIDGKRPRLSEGADLQYMLARDPGEHDGFIFFGDRFIGEVIGPRQKIMAARRQQALAELLTPGYAALLYGWLEGEAPKDVATLVATGLLDRDELRHADGTTIDFEPGTAARSNRWGSPQALTPLIELPTPAMVTEAERRAYDEFSRGYQSYWQQFIDPIAIRLDLEEDGDTAEAMIDVRVLPLISATEYSDIEEIVGTERIDVPAIDDGLQLVWAVGEESEIRRDLDRTASMFTGRKEIGLGWLGEWVMLGTLDRSSLAELVLLLDEEIQRPLTEPLDAQQRDLALARQIGSLPVYAAAHVRNPTVLVATLTAIKATLNEVAPGMVSWGEHGRYRDFAIVRVGIDSKAPGDVRDFADAIALYYVQTGDAIVLALDPKVLEGLIDRLVDGGGPRKGIETGPQFVMEGRLAQARPSWTAAAWALQGQANRTLASARSAAEILLRGDPRVHDEAELQALGLAYFGTYPVTASGSSAFTMGPQGAGDAVHGTEVAPRFPPLPVKGSPIEALMERLTGLRATVAFDREPAVMDPPARSLHTQLHVHLGGD